MLFKFEGLSGHTVGEDGRVVLNDPSRQQAVENMAEILESGANMGDFSQDGHFVSIAQLNSVYDVKH